MVVTGPRNQCQAASAAQVVDHCCEILAQEANGKVCEASGGDPQDIFFVQKKLTQEQAAEFSSIVEGCRNKPAHSYFPGADLDAIQRPTDDSLCPELTVSITPYVEGPSRVQCMCPPCACLYVYTS